MMTDEKKQQADFASWLSLQYSKGRKIPFSWHATNSRSKATPGVASSLLVFHARDKQAVKCRAR